MTETISIEEMKKIIERNGHKRKILGQSNPTDETISKIYNWIMERNRNRDVETIRRLHEYIEKKKRMNEFAENLQVKK